MQHRGKLLLLALTVIAAFAAVMVGAAGRSNASIPANFTAGSEQLTLSGCRNDGSITLPNGSGQFICPDAAYTTGNLGKGWNELDLVPFNVVTTTGNNDPTDYNVIIAGDYQLNGSTGWDVISSPTVNPSSDASCTVSANAQDVGPGITGGADSTIYKVLTIHQADNTTCRFDYYMRLALGAHNYPGSSLQAYVFSSSDFKGGKKTVPLPVNQILPQSLSKDMAATSSGRQAWNISKSPSPAVIHYGDVCSANFSNTQPLAVTVTWSKAGITPSGQVELITHVIATNPSARTITVTPTDKMYEGSTQTTQVGTTDVGSAVDVPANTTMTILTDDQIVSSTATSFNDVATATYTDKVTGVPVPGSTQATASATVNSTTLGQSATATDSESISGSGLTFAVATPSFGAFTGGYTHDTYTTGPVGWSSGTNAITSNGSVEFDKTIKLDPPQATSGSITDTAHITPSDGGSTVDSAPLTVNIDSTATSTLTINKSVSQAVSSDQTFHFDVLNSSNTVVASNVAVTVPKGSTSGSAQVSGLALGSYTVHEDTPPSGWSAAADAPVTLTGCTGSVTMSDQLAPATAFANKVTIPSGSQQGWTFTLTRPDNSQLTGISDLLGHVIWFGGTTTQAALSLEGSYTISETNQSGWAEVGAAQASGSTGTVNGGTGDGASCSFTVTYPADATKSFGCTITNVAQGHIIVKKVTHPSGATQLFTFTPSYNGGNAFQLSDGQSNDSGPLAAGSGYSVSEGAVAGWDLTSATCDNGDSPSNITVANNTTVTCTFVNTERGHIIVKKVTDPTGMTQLFTFNPSYGSSFQLSDGQQNDSGAIVPGSYSVSETAAGGNWTLASATCDNGNSPSAITLAAGQIVTCTFTNKLRGNVEVVKTLNGQPLTASSQQFTFELRQGDQSCVGCVTAPLQSLTTNGTNLGTLKFTVPLVPGQTYAMCELLVAGYGPNVSGSYGPYNPTDAPNYLCWNFTLTEAQANTTPESLVFNVDNSHATAKGLTIGFWKNHADSDCKKSKGKQTDVLGQYLDGIQLGAITFRDPAVSGYATECNAVQTLSKNTFSGVNKSSDPLFNMAAQLLAADLNVNQGDVPSSTVASTITAAQALLVKYGWNGQTYNGPLSSADAALANQYNTILDKFNNNQI